MANAIILDTMIAVLFTVGKTNPVYIPKHKKLSAYDDKDFAIICKIIENYSGIIFTPNVLTEASNILRYIGDPIKTEISTVFALIVEQSKEVYIGSAEAVARPEYLRLGITDSVLLLTSRINGTLLTADHDLHLAACVAGFKSINYNHVRGQRSDFAG